MPDAETDVLVWECGPHTNAWNGHDARCRQVPAPQADEHAVEKDAAEQPAEERLARALLTLVEVESCVAKVERYLATNGKYLDLDARVPMERQTEAMRAALNSWKADTTHGGSDA